MKFRERTRCRCYGILQHVFLLIHLARAERMMALKKRRLEIGDFETVNKIFQNVELSLPDSAIETSVLGNALTINLSNTLCRNFTIGDVKMDWFVEGPGNLYVPVELLQWNVTCSANYEYAYILGMEGEGTVRVTTENNYAGAMISFRSDDFETSLPDEFDIDSCTTQVGIKDLQFEGNGLDGILASVLNAVDSVIRGSVSNQIEEFICDTIVGWDEDLVGFLIKFNQSLRPYLNGEAGEPNPPLGAEEAMNVPEGLRLLDFRNPSTQLAMASETLIQEAGLFFAREVEDDRGGTTLAINNMLRTYLLKSDGSFPINMSTVPGIADGRWLHHDTLLGSLTLRVTSASIFGLDSFAKVDAFEAIGNYTLQTTMTIQSMLLELGAEVGLWPPNVTEGVQGVVESVQIGLPMDPVTVSLALLLAVNENALGSITLGSLLDEEKLLSCMFSTINKVEVASVSVHDMGIQLPRVDGFESPGLERIIQSALEATFTMYAPSFSRALPDLLEKKAAELMSGALAFVSLVSNCPAAPLSTDNSFLDFRDFLLPPEDAIDYGASGSAPYGALGFLLKAFLDRQLSSVVSESGKIGSSLMPGEDGTWVFEGDLLSLDTNITVGGFHAQIVFNITAARLENLMSLGRPLSLLDPVRGEPYMLNNTATVGVGNEPLQLKASMLIGIGEIRNEVEIGVGLHSTTLVVTLLAKILEQNFFSFPLQDVFDFACLMTMIPAPSLDVYGFRSEGEDATLSVRDLNLTPGDLSFTMKCISCSSPDLNKTAALLASPEGGQAAKQSAESVIRFVLTLVNGESSFLQSQVDRLLADTAKHCPSNAAYDPVAIPTAYKALEAVDTNTNDASAEYLVATLSVIGSLVVAALVLNLGVRWVVARRQRKWLRTLTNEQVIELVKKQEIKKEMEVKINRLTEPMYRSQQVPCYVRWIVPFIILGNIGLFLSGHLSLGGSVQIYLQLGGDQITVDNFYTFSIAQTAIDLWNAGGTEMAILILIFSGIWPYTKQLVTLVLWFLPPNVISVYRLGSILLWMDFLAKWSMVDVFVMILSVSAFRLTIESPNQPFLPENLYRVDFMVHPLWGLYANMSAQLVTQVVSHFIIHCNRRIEEAARKQFELDRIGKAESNSEEIALCDQADKQLLTQSNEYTGEAGLKCERLCDHAFQRHHRGENDRLVPRSQVNPALVGLAIALSVLVVAGCILPSVAFDYLGLVGVAIESGQDFEQAHVSYSIIQIAQLLMDQGRFLDTIRDKIGHGAISGLLVLTTLVVPVVQTCVLVCLWFCPLGRVPRNRFKVANEIASAWSFVEVFIIALLLSVWQLGDISEYMINEYCDALSGALANLVRHGLLSSEDAQCFRVQPSVKFATYLLIAAAMFLALLNSFVSKAVQQRQLEYAEESTNRMVQDEEDVVVNEDNGGLVKDIAPIPALFTDRFRWVLRKQPMTSLSETSVRCEPALDEDPDTAATCTGQG